METSADRRELWVVRLGRLPYDEALALQRAVAKARISGALSQDILLLVEHTPVVTLGRSSKTRHLLCSPAMLAARGIALFEVERGGDVTYHGPGQLVGYPIIDLKRHKQDLHWYLRQVEAALIAAVSLAGLAGRRNEGKTGVWIEDRKIASIGVHARDWVTWHGFALNVTTDLRAFDVIVPCGIPDVEMTSIARERGRQRSGALVEGADEGPVTLETASMLAARAFAETFGLAPVELPIGTLRAMLASEPDVVGLGAGSRTPPAAEPAAQHA